MHANSMNIMRELLKKYPPAECVYDIGSYDVNGTYKKLVDCKYVGVDIEAGPNVDVVVPEHGTWLFKLEQVDTIICGNVIEHVRRPWAWIKKLSSLLLPEGRLLMVTPWPFPKHDYPVDCWRLLPEGMSELLREGGLRVLEVGHENTDTWGVGQKPFYKKTES